MEHAIHNSPLGQSSAYVDEYTSDLLFAIPRQLKRDELGITPDALPFYGADVWNAYELSWLNAKGKPVVATGVFVLPCTTPNIIESKSIKLYLNSFNNSSFTDIDTVQKIIQEDLSTHAGAPVTVLLKEATHEPSTNNLIMPESMCIDDQDIICDTYQVDATLLKTKDNEAREQLHSHLLRSLCLVTGQPDWATLFIEYEGKQIAHDALLKYIVSFRNHNEFHEQCVERIFRDISAQCAPKQLTVYARYTRRGGLDINPCRSSDPNCNINNGKTVRQ